ncbi:glycerophosphodiester phosphodiesterase family protein [Hansschlegelia quercus]|uniref:Glycerophosphodiester phosphodiesterase n=1 Tax=Hansschlegelia quercus TaxID=2528245 RepID=A0A4Q9GJU0_9HYPH|nr:glycerophosphodiester phosphodiesterase family protein [Hansschlegelia quercus]TBN54398.1 glycerophosphodiester phosphodiesterase [Hansschlegelia quercus]
MGALDWLFARPIAHRGLHDRAAGIIENTPTAVSRAIDAGYGVEIDVRETADGGMVVIHDAVLDRLSAETGRIAVKTVAELRRIPIAHSGDLLWTLEDCLDLVGGRVPLVVEIKSPRKQGVEHARRVAERVAERSAQVALKSFNPRAVRVAKLYAPAIPCGLVGHEIKLDPAAGKPRGARGRALAKALRSPRIDEIDFLSWDIEDIDRPEVAVARASGKPVMCWTVKSPADRTRALVHADQIVFEGFLPDQNR